MHSWRMTLAGAALALAALPCLAPACTLCLNIRQTPTFRQEAARPSARLVLVGTVSNPRFLGDGGQGKTDFRVEEVLRLDPTLDRTLRKRKGDLLVLPTYLPVTDPKQPPRFLLFCDVFKGRYDPYRGEAVTSPALTQYLKGALALDPKDTRAALLYFFRHLDHPSPEVANDAFMEFVKASDREVGAIAGQLSAAKLRAWVKDPKTPAERLGLFAFLLGACGGKEDVAWFEATLAQPDGRSAESFDGILGGYIQLRPREGWDLAVRVFREGRLSLTVRLAAVRTLRFYQAWKPEESRAPVLRCLEALLAQGELADLAVEELRRWQRWELTEAVLKLYGRPGLDAPLQRRAILRYALSCPLPRARAFVAQLRKKETELVAEVEEGLHRDRR